MGSDSHDVAHFHVQAFRVSYQVEGPSGESLCPAVVTGPVFVQVARKVAHILELASICYSFVRITAALTFNWRIMQREITPDMNPHPAHTCRRSEVAHRRPGHRIRRNRLLGLATPHPQHLHQPNHLQCSGRGLNRFRRHPFNRSPRTSTMKPSAVADP
jgi:hypothetical protein